MKRVLTNPYFIIISIGILSVGFYILLNSFTKIQLRYIGVGIGILPLTFFIFLKSKKYAKKTKNIR